MNIEEVRELCLQMSYATEDMPFDDKTLVFRVGGKMFALLGLDSDPASINLKCEPEHAISLREEYPENVFPGYHMNKQHWNTVIVQLPITKSIFQEMLQHSYELIFQKLPKKTKEELQSIDS